MLLVYIVGICVLVASIATVIHLYVRKRTSEGVRSNTHNDVTAAVYATFGVLYAVILGLLVSHGQSRRDVVDSSSVREASLLVDIAQAAQAFGSANSDTLRRACIRYAEHVAEKEWNVDISSDPQAHHVHFDFIWNLVRNVEPTDLREQAIYASMLGTLQTLSLERAQRIAAAGDHMSPFLKVVLLIGAAVTVLFLWFFGMQDHRMHLTYTWLVTLMLGLVLVLIFALDNPMQQGIGVSPEAYHQAAQTLKALSTN
ncbi:MAG: DUF4239 domain-containing protein [Candidatus Kapabacteria bacterium]|nr:DUF4239 domain-containing protein [Candidatus Kapabacteria bacterium]